MTIVLLRDTNQCYIIIIICNIWREFWCFRFDEFQIVWGCSSIAVLVVCLCQSEHQSRIFVRCMSQDHKDLRFRSYLCGNFASKILFLFGYWSFLLDHEDSRFYLKRYSKKFSFVRLCVYLWVGGVLVFLPYWYFRLLNYSVPSNVWVILGVSCLFVVKRIVTGTYVSIKKEGFLFRMNLGVFVLPSFDFKRPPVPRDLRGSRSPGWTVSTSTPSPGTCTGPEVGPMDGSYSPSDVWCGGTLILRSILLPLYTKIKSLFVRQLSYLSTETGVSESTNRPYLVSLFPLTSRSDFLPLRPVPCLWRAGGGYVDQWEGPQ